MDGKSEILKGAASDSQASLAIDPESIDVFENDKDVREFLESFIGEREQGTKYEIAGEGDVSCRVKSCKYKKNEKNKNGFCLFHTQIATFCMSLVNGRKCETENCHRKSTIYVSLCNACYTDPEGQEEILKKVKTEEKSRWLDDKVLYESKKLTDRLIELVKEHPDYQLYIGITIRAMKIRLNEHFKSGKDFDDAFLALEVPNANSLADVEYHTILNVSTALGSKHLANKAAGGKSCCHFFIKL
jgi:hypothetical protein